jgi:hypothetical protein
MCLHVTLGHVTCFIILLFLSSSFVRRKNRQEDRVFLKREETEATQEM